MLSVEQIKELMATAGFQLVEEKEIAHGIQLRFSNGSTVSLYSSGKINIQGKDQDLVKGVLGQPAPAMPQGVQLIPVANGQAQKNRNVFVVYGHDTQSRTQLEAMLRRWGLEPLILDQLPSEGQTIIEKLESYTADVNFAVVLATPDDEGYRAGHPDERALRARQNVVLELGMLLSKLGRRRVAILLKQQENMERPSDIQGLIYIPFKDNLEKEAGLLLAKEMHAQGYQIDVSKI